MGLSEYKDTHSWQGAIDLGPRLAQLADELPAPEQMGLSWHLRQGMVDLPAAVAADLLADNGNTRRTVALQLVAALEVVERVYPAIDATPARRALDQLMQRLESPTGFTERITPPVAEAEAEESPETPETPASPETPESETPAAPAPVNPAEVELTPPSAGAAAVTHVQIHASEEVEAEHVQSNSGQ